MSELTQTTIAAIKAPIVTAKAATQLVAQGEPRHRRAALGLLLGGTGLAFGGTFIGYLVMHPDAMKATPNLLIYFAGALALLCVLAGIKMFDSAIFTELRDLVATIKGAK